MKYKMNDLMSSPLVRIIAYTLAIALAALRTHYLYYIEHKENAFIFALMVSIVLLISIGRDLYHWKRGEPL